MGWIFRAYKELIFRLVSIVGSFASLVGLVFTLGPDPRQFGGWTIGSLAIAIVFFVTSIVLEFKTVTGKCFIPIEKGKRIRDYMFQWIKTGGRVAIFSRDLTWVADDEIKRLLISKAKSDEITICVPKETKLTEDLAVEGARIHTYSQTDHVPQSRFTVVNFGRGNARVAVGHRHGDLHVIEEFLLMIIQHSIWRLTLSNLLPKTRELRYLADVAASKKQAT
jgi:hypothetical protein